MNASRMCILELLDYAEAADARYNRVSEDCRKTMDRKAAYIEKLEEENAELRKNLDEWKRHAANLEGALSNMAQGPQPDHVVTNVSDEPLNQCSRPNPNVRLHSVEPPPDSPHLEKSVVGTEEEDDDESPF